jgi:hypothetical protein
MESANEVNTIHTVILYEKLDAVLISYHRCDKSEVFHNSGGASLFV